ncbi:hypothetical protein BZY49_29180, partial [Klebsiella pneumoniae]
MNMPAATGRRTTASGSRTCLPIQYNADKGHMTKCDGCHERVAEGKKPICVESCPLRALDF